MTDPAIKMLTDIIALYVEREDWKHPNHTLREAMVVLMDAYDAGATITLSHANYIDDHRAELTTLRRWMIEESWYQPRNSVHGA